MKRIGITGQSGFIGTHLSNNLRLYPEKYTLVSFSDEFFEDINKLNDFVASCDLIVHLSALNRHNEPENIFSTNIRLVNSLIESCVITGSHPHIIFSSSIQEELTNPYGRSKYQGRILFEEWAHQNKARFTGFIIPNVFGPFGKPYYNSVVSTFCHKLTHNEQPQIITDSEIKLIYIDELIALILQQIDNESTTDNINKINVTSSITIRVSDLLNKIGKIKEQYLQHGLLPDLSGKFDRNLFNTFLSHIDYESFFPYHMPVKSDNRGSFAEIIKTISGGQISFSTTKPGITRGNHYHTRKVERFAVIRGKARIEFRRSGTNKKYCFELYGDQPSFVDMPVWFTHNITNIGNDDMYTIFWISEHFDPSDTDTFFEQV